MCGVPESDRGRKVIPELKTENDPGFQNSENVKTENDPGFQNSENVKKESDPGCHNIISREIVLLMNHVELEIS